MQEVDQDSLQEEQGGERDKVEGLADYRCLHKQHAAVLSWSTLDVWLRDV